jgi:CRP-like cAMP-binding protein
MKVLSLHRSTPRENKRKCLTTIPSAVNPRGVRSFNRRHALPNLAGFVWKIETGIVKTFTWNDEGELITLGIWGAGDIVGSLLSSNAPYEIECLTDVTVYLIAGDRLDTMVEEILAHIRANQEFIQVVRHRRIERAILGLFDWLSHRFGRVVSQGIAIDFLITHQEIAEIIGTTRVTCSRTISSLIAQGYIAKQQRYYIVRSHLL